MAQAGAQIEGAARLRSTLRRAGAQMGDFRGLHLDVAGLVAGQGKRTAPRGPGPRHIADTVRSGATQRAAIIRAGNARLPYAGPIHWGWRRRNIKPQPWLAQAAKQTEPRWLEVYFTGLENIVRTIEGA